MYKFPLRELSFIYYLLHLQKFKNQYSHGTITILWDGKQTPHP